MAISCDPSSLAAAAKCFETCSRGPIGKAIKTYLLCQVAQGGGAPCVDPAVPTNIDIDTDASSQGNTFLTWANSDVPERNEIWKSTDQGASFAFYAQVPGGTHVYNDVAAMADGTIWYYQVKACNSTCCSAFTEMRGVAAEAFNATTQTMPFLVEAYGQIDFSGVAIVGLLDLRRLERVGTLIANAQPTMTAINITLLTLATGGIDLSGSGLLTLSAPALTFSGALFSVNSCNSLTSVSCPVFIQVATLDLSNCAALNSITFTMFTNCVGVLDLNNTGDGTLNASFPALTNVASHLNANSFSGAALSAPVCNNISGNLDMSGSTIVTATFTNLISALNIFGTNASGLVSIDFTSLQSTADLNFSTCTSLTTANFPALANVGFVGFFNSPNLTDITFANGCSFTSDVLFNNCTALANATIGSGANISDGFSIDFQNDALLVGNSGAGIGVDGILRQCQNNGLAAATIALDGGTNATPSAAGLVDKGLLIGAGCVVLTN